MQKKSPFTRSKEEQSDHKIPDIEIIDLENEDLSDQTDADLDAEPVVPGTEPVVLDAESVVPGTAPLSPGTGPVVLDAESADPDAEPMDLGAEPADPDAEPMDLGAESANPDASRDSEDPPQKKGFRINLHVVLLVVVVLFVTILFVRFKNWGQFINQEDVRNNIEGTYEDILDVIIPLTGDDGRMIPLNTDDGLSIVFFGNSPFSDDRDSEDSLANIIADMTGATVYNCSVSQSYLAAERPLFIAQDRPLDAYTFYWLSVLATGLGTYDMYDQAVAVMGEATPPDAVQACETIQSIDYSTVDIIAIMYDGYDYLVGHPMYTDENPSDITQFTGNLDAGIKLLQATYPHIRIIVLSPPYAFSKEIDEDGNYISSDQVRYGRDVLSTYVIKQYSTCAENQVTFVDNLYGTITEDNAAEYLIDNIHLNVEGRRKVAQRFVYALNYYERD